MTIRRRFFLATPDEPPLRRWVRRLTGRPVPGFPRTVQIQTATGCNADCLFCPYGETHGTQPHGRMDDTLFRKLIDECGRHRVRRISPYLMNEPFVDPDLPDRIRYIKRRAPGSRVVVTTNGSLLHPPVIERLLDLQPGLDDLSVSIQGVDPQVYRDTMRGSMRLPDTLRNIDHLLARQRARRLRRPRLQVSMVRTARLDLPAALRYWRRRGVRCRYTEMDNRGGLRPDADLSPAGSFEPNTTCTRLFRQAYILWNGDMVLCCADWRRQVVLGNVRDRSIEAVWNDAPAVAIRRAYIDGHFGALTLCRDCRVDRVRERSDRPRLVMARWQAPARSAPAHQGTAATGSAAGGPVD